MQHDMRGAAAVGQLEMCTPWEALLIRHLRLWCDGPEGRKQVCAFWETHAGPVQGPNVVMQFDALVQSLLTFGRRPLARHSVGCMCVGADEAVFAQIAGDASGGHLDDAVVLSGLIALPAQAEPIALLAGQVGTSFRGACEATAPPPHPATNPVRRVLH